MTLIAPDGTAFPATTARGASRASPCAACALDRVLLAGARAGGRRGARGRARAGRSCSRTAAWRAWSRERRRPRVCAPRLVVGADGRRSRGGAPAGPPARAPPPAQVRRARLLGRHGGLGERGEMHVVGGGYCGIAPLSGDAAPTSTFVLGRARDGAARAATSKASTAATLARAGRASSSGWRGPAPRSAARHRPAGPGGARVSAPARRAGRRRRRLLRSVHRRRRDARPAQRGDAGGGGGPRAAHGRAGRPRRIRPRSRDEATRDKFRLNRLLQRVVAWPALANAVARRLAAPPRPGRPARRASPATSCPRARRSARGSCGIWSAAHHQHRVAELVGQVALALRRERCARFSSGRRREARSRSKWLAPGSCMPVRRPSTTRGRELGADAQRRRPRVPAPSARRAGRRRPSSARTTVVPDGDHAAAAARGSPRSRATRRGGHLVALGQRQRASSAGSPVEDRPARVGHASRAPMPRAPQRRAGTRPGERPARRRHLGRPRPRGVRASGTCHSASGCGQVRVLHGPAVRGRAPARARAVAVEAHVAPAAARPRPHADHGRASERRPRGERRRAAAPRRRAGGLRSACASRRRRRARPAHASPSPAPPSRRSSTASPPRPCPRSDGGQGGRVVHDQQVAGAQQRGQVADAEIVERARRRIDRAAAGPASAASRGQGAAALTRPPPAPCRLQPRSARQALGARISSSDAAPPPSAGSASAARSASGHRLRVHARVHLARVDGENAHAGALQLRGPDAAGGRAPPSTRRRRPSAGTRRRAASERDVQHEAVGRAAPSSPATALVSRNGPDAG